MKNDSLRIPLFILIVGLSLSCRTSEETLARREANKFLTYLYSKQYSEAKKCATPGSAVVLEMMEAFATFDSSRKPVVFRITQIEIQGETARCTYEYDGKVEYLDMKKMKGKWLADLKKESPPPPPPIDDDMRKKAIEDSLAAVEAARDAVPDTATFLDFSILSLTASGTSTVIILELRNRFYYDLKHLWMEICFSDRNGKFMLKRDAMFDNLEKVPTDEEGNALPAYHNRAEVKLTLEKCKPGDIGEVYLILKRFSMEPEFYSDYTYEGEMYYVSRYMNLKNYSDCKIEITF